MSSRHTFNSCRRCPQSRPNHLNSLPLLEPMQRRSGPSAKKGEGNITFGFSWSTDTCRNPRSINLIPQTQSRWTVSMHVSWDLWQTTLIGLLVCEFYSNPLSSSQADLRAVVMIFLKGSRLHEGKGMYWCCLGSWQFFYWSHRRYSILLPFPS